MKRIDAVAERLTPNTGHNVRLAGAVLLVGLHQRHLPMFQRLLFHDATRNVRLWIAVGIYVI